MILIHILKHIKYKIILEYIQKERFLKESLFSMFTFTIRANRSLKKQ